MVNTRDDAKYSAHQETEPRLRVSSMRANDTPSFRKTRSRSHVYIGTSGTREFADLSFSTLLMHRVRAGVVDPGYPTTVRRGKRSWKIRFPTTPPRCRACTYTCSARHCTPPSSSMYTPMHYVQLYIYTYVHTYMAR